ncbi:MAG: polynucleotide adenylyltransferase [Acidimicrobiia bacterium]|nr:polynucleotide adenylyltransferase [Acidimicrobiia bacterium]
MLALDLIPPHTLECTLEICRRARAAGGRGVLVGGAPRDVLAGVAVEDIDIEVSGIPLDRLAAVLEGFDIDPTGQAFGVFKLSDVGIDVSLPRLETKHGSHHRDFDVTPDPNLPFEVAARRRDFTINAIGFDPIEQVLLDPFGGAEDLERRTLRAVDDQRFVEDELRVLRGMQLVARFGLTPDRATVGLCSTLDMEHLVASRVFDEWQKMILTGTHIKQGLDFLEAVGWLRFFPELAATVGVPQDPKWHPEGDVFVHTGHCMDEFALRRVGDAHEDLVVGLAVLCHDFGKPATTEFTDGRWRAHGHDVAGVDPTRSFLRRLTEQPIWLEVEPLVAAHLRPSQLHMAQAGKGAVRRLARSVGRLDRLVRVAEADARGRPPLVMDRFEAGDWLLDQARDEDLTTKGPQPVLLGRHLISEFGIEPGPAFRPLLDAAFEAQLDGAFEDLPGAIDWVRQHR